MSSRAGAKHGGNQRGKNVVEKDVEKQLVQAVAEVSLESNDDGGEWEVISRKSKNRGSNSIAKSWNTPNVSHKAWADSDVGVQKQVRGHDAAARMPVNERHSSDSWKHGDRGSSRHEKGWNNSDVQQVLGPALQHGWNWQARTRNSPVATDYNKTSDSHYQVTQDDNEVDDGDNNVEAVEDEDDDDDDDDELFSEDFDSDASQQSYNSRKNNRWFKKFFDNLDNFSAEQINEPARQWHCPACKGGPGAIDWYRGLQPLITHAKTKESKRVKLHREFGVLLAEELRLRAISILPPSEAFGKWKGLQEESKDRDIVWPPMVIIMNTKLEKDDNDKWIGMGNQELLDYFCEYSAVKARHSYGPQGHRGMSALIFENTATGYFEAERLDKHFAEQRTDRNAWERRRILFHPGGKRQLYGYMAVKEDLDVFNHHSQGKSKLKFEIRSYNEMIVKQIRKMQEDNQQLIWLKGKVAKEKQHSKMLEESFGSVSRQLKNIMEENKIVRQKTQMHSKKKNEEMIYQEKFFKGQLNLIYEKRDAKEGDFVDMFEQETRHQVDKKNTAPTDASNFKSRAQEITDLIELQDKEMEEFSAERDKLVKFHDEKLIEMRRRHWEEEVQFEKDYDEELDRLMEKYSRQ